MTLQVIQNWSRAAVFGSDLTARAVRAKLKTLREKLAGPDPSPLERLLVDRVLICWLQVHHADLRCAGFHATGGTIRDGEYHYKQLGAAQKRYLAAIRTLAQVRRLLGPAVVQVNIAERQVNLAQVEGNQQ